MAQYYNITKEEMDNFLTPQGFRTIELPNTLELVYAKRADFNNMQISMRVYTGIDKSGASRDTGEDAIRVHLFTRKHDGSPVNLFGSKRVHRVQGWKRNLQNRIDETSKQIQGLKICFKCGLPMKFQKGISKKTGQAYAFYGCIGYPACTNTMPYYEKTN